MLSGPDDDDRKPVAADVFVHDCFHLISGDFTEFGRVFVVVVDRIAVENAFEPGAGLLFDGLHTHDHTTGDAKLAF